MPEQHCSTELSTLMEIIYICIVSYCEYCTLEMFLVTMNNEISNFIPLNLNIHEWLLASVWEQLAGCFLFWTSPVTV
jgi:hypothetical protein